MAFGEIVAKIREGKGDAINGITSTIVYDTQGNKISIDINTKENLIIYTITETVQRNVFVGRVERSADTETGVIPKTSDPIWQIELTSTSGIEVIKLFAGVGEFDQIWDNRVSLFPESMVTNQASLLFDGADEYIDLGDNYDFGPAIAFTWSFWMKANNFSAQRCFIAKTTPDANVFGYSFQHTNAGKLFLQVRASGTLPSKTFSTTLIAGTWYHICFTYSGNSNISGFTPYIDAVAEIPAASFALNDWNNASPLRFAQRGSVFHFSGNLNQITVWDKEFSAAEVTELFNTGFPGEPTNHSAAASLQSHWPLNESSSFPTEVDVKGSINGTLVNMEIEDYDLGDVP